MKSTKEGREFVQGEAYQAAVAGIIEDLGAEHVVHSGEPAVDPLWDCLGVYTAVVLCGEAPNLRVCSATDQEVREFLKTNAEEIAQIILASWHPRDEHGTREAAEAAS